LKLAAPEQSGAASLCGPLILCGLRAAAQPIESIEFGCKRLSQIAGRDALRSVRQMKAFKLDHV
jgi:hypothetical protein